MTTSGTGRRGGFTLIEVAVAISIFLIIVGMAIPLVGGGLRENAIAADEAGLQKLVRMAQHRALERRARHNMVLHHDRLALVAANDPGTELAGWDLDSGTTYLFRHGADAEWIKPEGQAWVIQPNGLARSIDVLLINGPVRRGLRFHPLTLNAEVLETP